MSVLAIAVENDVTSHRFALAQPCHCGAGWCPRHGTDHLSEEQEVLASELRAENRRYNGRRGRRVIRKRLDD